MKKIITTFLLSSLSFVVLKAQITVLTFTGRDSLNQHVPMSRVVVRNLFHNWEETLYWPDTVLVMGATGIGDAETGCASSLQLSQNSPNPFDGITSVELRAAEPGDVEVEILDIAGRVVGVSSYSLLQPGAHEIHITLSSAGVYLLTARQNGRSASVKMLNRGNGAGNTITFSDDGTSRIPASDSPKTDNSSKGGTNNSFAPGHRMEYIGYAIQDGVEVESGHKVQMQYNSQTVVLTFGVSPVDGQPCPGSPTVTDIDGNVYNTVQIDYQCWMRENLRTTHYSDGTPIPAGGDNLSDTDPYYYDYSSSDIPLSERGYLYNWPAVMHGKSSSNSVPSEVRGVCPTGWHVPSDPEFVVLTDYLSSRAEYICGGETTNIAKALASTTWWEEYIDYQSICSPSDQSVNANNASGFSAIPAGWFWTGGLEEGQFAKFWSCTERMPGSSWGIYLQWVWPEVTRFYTAQYLGHSVRCLRD